MSLMYLTVLDLYISQVLNIMASGHLISINCLASCMNLSKGVIWYPFLSVKKMPLLFAMPCAEMIMIIMSLTRA